MKDWNPGERSPRSTANGRGGPETGALRAGASRAGMGDAMGGVGPVVDAAAPRVGRGGRAAKQPAPHAVGGRAVTSVTGGPTARHTCHAHGPRERALAREPAAV